MPSLLDPVQIGALQLPNRILMAPLTRCRASEGRVPNVLNAEYYRQRASAGLIITEATAVSPMGIGYPDTPGIWSKPQVKGWQMVTKAVHDAGGRIVCQLWHVGRISDPSYLLGEQPVGPSAIAAEGHVSLLRPETPFPVPRALELQEIPGIIEEYRRGAENALEAGFDGVELHGANGYLPDQFLHSNSNHRSDEYGGSVANRARFMLEALDAAISVWGADRVGLHLSPADNAHGVSDSDPASLYQHVVSECSKRSLAFICAREPMNSPNRLGPSLKKAFSGVYVANDTFTRETAEEVMAKGEADAVAFGRLFISNPDLPKRFELHATLNAPNPMTFYRQPADVGYTDYPSLEEAVKQG